MGQKVNPTGLRLGINRTWDSRWYADKKEYGKLLQQDIKIRAYLTEKLKQAGISRVVIERRPLFYFRVDVCDRDQDLGRWRRDRLGDRELIEIARVVVVDRRP